MFPLNLGPQARARKADPERLVKGTCCTIVPAPFLHRSPGIVGEREYRNARLVWARVLFFFSAHYPSPSSKGPQGCAVFC